MIECLVEMRCNHCLVSVVAIAGIASMCLVGMGLGIDGAAIYAGIGAISGIAGYSIRKFNGQKGS